MAVAISKDLFLKIDKAEGGYIKGIHIYRIKHKENINLAIEELCSTWNFIEFLHNVDTKLDLELEDTIDLELQKVGNCDWISTKMSLFATAYLMIREKHPEASSDACIQAAKALYKDFINFDRTDSLVEYASQNPEEVVLNGIAKKLQEDRKVKQLGPARGRKIIDLLTNIFIQKLAPAVS
jgi:hypothetical protein